MGRIGDGAKIKYQWHHFSGELIIRISWDKGSVQLSVSFLWECSIKCVISFLILWLY